MKSVEYPRTETSITSWKEFWRDADAVVERCRAGLPDQYELRFISIDARTGALTVFYEERKVPVENVRTTDPVPAEPNPGSIRGGSEETEALST